MESSITQLSHYNDWANTKVLTALMKLGSDVPPRCVQLFSHIVNAQVIWLARIQGTAAGVEVWQLQDLATCERMQQSFTDKFQETIVAQDLALSSTVNYTNSKKDAFHNSLQDIIIHIFNHGTYHRAQIATEIRQNGFTPDNTDYITFVR